MTGDDRFKEVMIPEDRKKDTTMCEIVDSFVNKGITQGISQGISLGVEQDIRSINNLVESGEVPADIANIIIAKLSESRK